MCHPLQSATRKVKGNLLLYYITDRAQFSGDEEQKQRRLLDTIAECAMAGVDFIQLREKDLTPRDLERLGTKALSVMPPGSPTRLLINSRVDLALACGAHGVHIPAGGLPASEVRTIWMKASSSTPVIAVSTHSVAEVALAEAHGADFAVFGPVFEKDGNANPAGLEQLRNACNRPQHAVPAMPIFALGGVTLNNVPECVTAGAAGIAGIRLFQESEPRLMVQRLRAISPDVQG